MTIRDYHQRSKHAQHRSALGPGYLDWDTQADPFRRYDGARRFDLPLSLDRSITPFNQIEGGAPAALDGAGLGLFLELALGLSAWKEFGGTRWVLRNNPSSGNLHPTEGWVLLSRETGISDRPALYHYSPLHHALEERCSWTGPCGLPDCAFLFALSSVPWRESWKYGERAFRYCQLDAGHAVASAAYAAACLGWRLRVLAGPGDEQLRTLLGLDRADAHHPGEPEHPELAAVVWTDSSVEVAIDLPTLPAVASWHGRANLLSPDHEVWPAVDLAQDLATKPMAWSTPTPFITSSVTLAAPEIDAGVVIRRRRSAQRMDPTVGMGRRACFRLLASTLADYTKVPWSSFPWAPRLSLFLFVHHVEGLVPGLYALIRDADSLPRLRQAVDKRFLWQPVPDCPLPLFHLSPGGLRAGAASLSCGQDIAGDGAFSVAMVADFDRTLDEEGDWAYRRLFWEAGMIGHVLYLEATAAGLSGTGIGCYFDDDVHAELGMATGSMAWQSLYHFTIGRAIDDARISSTPPFAHLLRT